MTRSERIHSLFNQLHRELEQDAQVLDNEDVHVDDNPTILEIASTIDAAHHDYTELTLQEIA